MALKQLSLVRGNDKTYTLTIKHADGTPYCLKDWVIIFTVKKSYDLPDASASIQKIVTTFSDTTSGTTGVAEIPLVHSDSINIETGEYDFDIQATTSDSETYTIMRGKYEIEYNVTKSSGTAYFYKVINGTLSIPISLSGTLGTA